MSNIYKLYELENKCVKKSVNIENTLYEKLKYLTETKYDATVSDIINIAIEDYIMKNEPKYYGKPVNEYVTYRSLMLREFNINELKAMSYNSRISFTRLVNGAIKEFLDTQE